MFLNYISPQDVTLTVCCCQ